MSTLLRRVGFKLKLSSSMHIEPLVSMIELPNQIYTGRSRHLPGCIYATYECICVEYSAKYYVFFTLVCVGFVELFGMTYETLPQNRAANARICIFISPNTPRFFVCAWCNSTVALVAYERCLWRLGPYVTEPPNRGLMIMLLKPMPMHMQNKDTNQRPKTKTKTGVVTLKLQNSSTATPNT